MARRRLSRSQILEFLIVVGIILFSLYRVALAYDYVPYAYQPQVIGDKIYQQSKIWLVEVEAENNFLGHAARAIVKQMTRIEAYFLAQSERYRQINEIAKRCNENIIYRYFMFMGDLTNPNCSESNIGLKNAIGDVNNTANSTTNNTTTTTTPAPSPTQPAATPGQSTAATATPAVPVTPAQPATIQPIAPQPATVPATTQSQS